MEIAIHIPFTLGLICKLWEESFTPAQLQGGFKACGIYPLNRRAISDAKLAISVPFTGHSSGCTENLEHCTTEAAEADSTQDTTTATATACTVLDIKCNDCGRCLTPVRMHVVAYFAQHLKKEVQHQKRDNRRLKPRYYGEVLTRDDIIERMEKEAEEKQKKRGKRAKKVSEDCAGTNDHGESNGIYLIIYVMFSIHTLIFAQTKMKMKNVVKDVGGGMKMMIR